MDDHDVHATAVLPIVGYGVVLVSCAMSGNVLPAVVFALLFAASIVYSACEITPAHIRVLAAVVTAIGVVVVIRAAALYGNTARRSVRLVVDALALSLSLEKIRDMFYQQSAQPSASHQIPRSSYTFMTILATALSFLLADVTPRSRLLPSGLVTAILLCTVIVLLYARTVDNERAVLTYVVIHVLALLAPAVNAYQHAYLVFSLFAAFQVIAFLVAFKFNALTGLPQLPQHVTEQKTVDVEATTELKPPVVVIAATAASTSSTEPPPTTTPQTSNELEFDMSLLFAPQKTTRSDTYYVPKPPTKPPHRKHAFASTSARPPNA